MSPADKPVRVGMLGCGVVGSQVARLLLEDTAELSTRAGVKIELTRIAVRTIKDYPGLDPKLFTTDPFSIVNDPDIDLIVEVMGGIEPARELAMTAINNRKSIVTANKALLASHGADLFTAAYAKGEDIYYEASVAGAIPIIRPMRDSLAGDFVTRLMGIVNGTTNYILTKMHEDNREFADVFKEAQALGYAEADPTADVEGFDAAAKAAILSGLAFHTRVTVDDVYREGISKITLKDVNIAKSMEKENVFFNYIIPSKELSYADQRKNKKILKKEFNRPNELIIFDQVMSEADRKTVNGYLNTKYNLGMSAGNIPVNLVFNSLTLSGSASYRKAVTITANVSLANDQQPDNNSMIANIISASSSPAITGSATGCNENVQLLVSNPKGDDQYLWYDKNNDVSRPIAKGSVIRTSTTAKNVYVGKGWNGFIGPKDNTTLSSTGGYNNWGSNYGEFIRFNTTGPIQLETTKLYTGYAGKIELELRALSTFTDTTYSYFPSQTQKAILHVGASSPSPTPATGSAGSGTPTPFVQGDTGRIYAINMNISQAGNYILIARCLDSATIFRNNNITTNNHPFGPTVLASITGNWAGANFEKFYYFFYNMQISTPKYEKALSKIPVILTAKPVISQIGIDSLNTTAADTYQWFMNDETIAGATKSGIKVTKNAMYKVSATTGTCTNYSDNKLVLIIQEAVEKLPNALPAIKTNVGEFVEVKFNPEWEKLSEESRMPSSA